MKRIFLKSWSNGAIVRSLASAVQFFAQVAEKFFAGISAELQNDVQCKSSLVQQCCFWRKVSKSFLETHAEKRATIQGFADRSGVKFQEEIFGMFL